MNTEEKFKNQSSRESSQEFSELFRLYHQHLRNYIFTIIPDTDEAKEIAQQCFVQLWENRELTSSIHSLKAYLFRSAYNMCMNRFKHEKIKQQYASETRYLLDEMFFEDFDNTYDTDLSEQIKAAVEELPDKNKEVFKLRYFNGYDTQEVSEELDITVRTVETHITKSFRLLRAKLQHLLLLAIVLAGSLLVKSW